MGGFPDDDLIGSEASRRDERFNDREQTQRAEDDMAQFGSSQDRDDVMEREQAFRDEAARRDGNDWQ